MERLGPSINALIMQNAPFDPEHFSQRYARQLILPEVGEVGQQKLLRAKVTVIGAGGLGCPVVQYLAAAGVGEITIVDGDTVDLSNLQRQVAYHILDIGEPKVQVLAKRMALLNPMVKVIPIQKFVDAENILPLIEHAQVVVDCTDTFDSRYLINDACIIAQKPFVAASLQGFTGQLSVFNFNGGPTYRCLYPDPPDAQDAPNCNEIGVIGVIPGIMGSLQANEVLKIILNIGRVLSGELLCFDALKMDFQNFAFDLNKANLVPRALHNSANSCDTTEKQYEIPPEYLKFAPHSNMHAHTNAAQSIVTGIKANLQSIQLQMPGKPAQHALLLDVREIWEFAQNPIPHAVNVPLTQLLAMDKPSILQKMKMTTTSDPLVCVCYSGVRSHKALVWLLEQGFDNVYAVKGGVKAWPAALRNAK